MSDTESATASVSSDAEPVADTASVSDESVPTTESSNETSSDSSDESFSDRLSRWGSAAVARFKGMYNRTPAENSSQNDDSDSLSSRFARWAGTRAAQFANSYDQTRTPQSSPPETPSESPGDTAQDSGLTVEYLLQLARVLTSDQRFMVPQGVSTADLLQLATAPNCDESSNDLQKNPYFELVGALTSDPPSYDGTNPIEDIVETIRQLGSCQNSSSTLLSKIGDFFMRRDAGKTLKDLLLSADVVIQCLALWYVMGRNGLLDSPTSIDYRVLQQFCADAISSAHDVNRVDELPPSVERALPRVQQWDGRLETVIETFQVGSAYPAPVLLIFNPAALQQVLENGGMLPTQVSLDTTDHSNDQYSLPMIFLPQSKISQVARDYLASGQVKPAEQ